ncbi:hypothetical protein TELCIR_10481 [Teladorsagia circumcincta]|uniref:Fatty acid desaturase domain-containing protein n=1 Tax=Teladorsagia circumcincta TaxID=45464 RepID=A0A2G9UC01_TELCI|nr:hypothetical protein TELCIR_10481 [Teladorsagia circumcincta]
MLPGYEDVNMGDFDITEEKSKSITKSFDELRLRVRQEGLMDGSMLFYCRKGFSSGGWKEQHNIHHAATNVVGRDGDLDLMPLWATVVQDLKVN